MVQGKSNDREPRMNYTEMDVKLNILEPIDKADGSAEKQAETRLLLQGMHGIVVDQMHECNLTDTPNEKRIYADFLDRLESILHQLDLMQPD